MAFDVYLDVNAELVEFRHKDNIRSNGNKWSTINISHPNCAFSNVAVPIGAVADPVVYYYSADVPSINTSALSIFKPINLPLFPTTDENKCVPTKCEDLSVLSVPNLSKSLDVAIYPNPSNGNFTLQFVNYQQTVTIAIFNTLGQQVTFGVYTVNGKELALGNLNLNKGIFIVTLLTDKGMSTSAKLLIE